MIEAQILDLINNRSLNTLTGRERLLVNEVKRLRDALQTTIEKVKKADGQFYDFHVIDTTEDDAAEARNDDAYYASIGGGGGGVDDDVASLSGTKGGDDLDEEM